MIKTECLVVNNYNDKAWHSSSFDACHRYSGSTSSKVGHVMVKNLEMAFWLRMLLRKTAVERPTGGNWEKSSSMKNSPTRIAIQSQSLVWNLWIGISKFNLGVHSECKINYRNLLMLMAELSPINLAPIQFSSIQCDRTRSHFHMQDEREGLWSHRFTYKFSLSSTNQTRISPSSPKPPWPLFEPFSACKRWDSPLKCKERLDATSPGSVGIGSRAG